MNLKPVIEKDNELQTSNAAKLPTASQFTILVITVAAVYDRRGCHNCGIVSGHRSCEKIEETQL